MSDWHKFLVEEKKLAKGSDEKFWSALPASLSDKDRADIVAAASKLNITVKRNSKTGPLELVWS